MVGSGLTAVNQSVWDARILRHAKCALREKCVILVKQRRFTPTLSELLDGHVMDVCKGRIFVSVCRKSSVLVVKTSKMANVKNVRICLQNALLMVSIIIITKCISSPPKYRLLCSATPFLTARLHVPAMRNWGEDYKPIWSTLYTFLSKVPLRA